jgi:hypothetical protein
MKSVRRSVYGTDKGGGPEPMDDEGIPFLRSHGNDHPGGHRLFISMCSEFQNIAPQSISDWMMSVLGPVKRPQE